jgi:hypothetical protein
VKYSVTIHVGNEVSAMKALLLHRFVLFVFACSLAAVSFSGCGYGGEKMPALGVTNWHPQVVGGPVSIRPLPPADRVMAEYDQWQKSETSKCAKVYNIVLQGIYQINFETRITRGDTPVGATDTTWVSFVYNDPTNGLYQLVWHLRGRHNLDFLKLGTRTMEVWLQPVSVLEDSKIPRLSIAAMEGVEPLHALIASQGGAQPK